MNRWDIPSYAVGWTEESPITAAPTPPKLLSGVGKTLAIVIAASITTGVGVMIGQHSEGTPERISADTYFAPGEQCRAVPAVAAASLRQALKFDSQALRAQETHRQRAQAEGMQIDPRLTAQKAGESFRQKLARRFGVTVVGQNAINQALVAINATTTVPETVAALDEFTTHEFHIPTTATLTVPEGEKTKVEPLDLATQDVDDIEYVKTNARTIVQDLSALPKQLVRAAHVESFQLANKLTDPHQSPSAAFTYLTTKPASVYLDIMNSQLTQDKYDSVIIHELTHRWQGQFCDKFATQDAPFIKLNPKGFYYEPNQSDNNPYTEVEKLATATQYSTESPTEDGAEILGAGIPTGFETVTHKPVVGAKSWMMLARLNAVAEGSGSFLSAMANSTGHSPKAFVDPECRVCA